MKIAGISAKVAHTHVEKHQKPEDGRGVIILNLQKDGHDIA